jgi:hypothetical protein
MVTSAELDEELEVELDDELDDELELDVEAPPPLTVWPTDPFTAVTVPLISATSWVSCSDFSFCSRVVISWAMAPWSCTKPTLLWEIVDLSCVMVDLSCVMVDLSASMLDEDAFMFA